MPAPTQHAGSPFQTGWTSGATKTAGGGLAVGVGDLIVVQAIGEDAGQSFSTPTNVASGPATITWTRRGNVSVGSRCEGDSWTGEVTAAGNLTVSVTETVGNQVNWGMVVYAFPASGHGGLGLTPAGANGSGSGPTLTGAWTADSMICCACGDWSAVAHGPPRDYRTGAGAATEVNYANVDGNYSTEAWYHADANGGSNAVGLATPNMTWTLLVVEVLGTAGAPEPTVEAFRARIPEVGGSLLSPGLIGPGVESRAIDDLGRKPGASPASHGLFALRVLEQQGTVLEETAPGTPIDPAIEADEAPALGRTKQAAVTAATETDTANTVGRAKTLALAAATETSIAPAIGRAKARTSAAATETDTAPTIEVRPIRVTLAASSESDSAPAIGRTKTKATAAATETDTANTLGRAKRAPVTAATETDTAPAVARRKLKTLTAASETDSATVVGRRKAKLLGPSEEADTATTIAGAGVSFTHAAETDTAPGLARAKAKAVTAAAESDSAVQLGEAKRRAITAAQESDAAGTLARAKRRLLGPASETDTAGTLVGRKVKALGQAVETNVAQALGALGGLLVAALLRLRTWDHRAVASRHHDHRALRSTPADHAAVRTTRSEHAALTSHPHDHPADDTDPSDH